MTQKIEKFLQELITGKIPTDINLHQPDSFENGETFTEDIDIELPDDCSINCEFEWSYSREKGMKGDGFITPDDSDELTLDWLNIISFTYFETEITPLKLGPLFEYPKLKGLMLQFLSNEILDTYTNKIGRSIQQEIKSLKDKGETTFVSQKESRLMKFEQFVNENKTITSSQMVKSFVINVDAGWIMKSILTDRKNIGSQLVEHFDATYGIGNLEKQYPKEFKIAVDELCKIYLKK